MKLKALIATLIVTPIVLTSHAHAQDVQIDDDLYELCSRFPLNSRCEGLDVPIALDRRSGDEGDCEFTSGETSLSGNCKVVFTDEMMTAYIEVGDHLDLLDDERSTQEVSVPLNRIATLVYREGTQVNAGRLALNTLAFGVLGALTTRPDRVSQVEVGFLLEAVAAPTTESTSKPTTELTLTEPAIPASEAVAEPTSELASEPASGAEPMAESTSEPMTETAIAEPMAEPAETAAEPTAESAIDPTVETATELIPEPVTDSAPVVELNPSNSGLFVFEADREMGMAVRSKLEQLTNIQAEVPPEEN
jgi:hypothetical protein